MLDGVLGETGQSCGAYSVLVVPSAAGVVVVASVAQVVSGARGSPGKASRQTDWPRHWGRAGREGLRSRRRVVFGRFMSFPSQAPVVPGHHDRFRLPSLVRSPARPPLRPAPRSLCVVYRSTANPQSLALSP